MSAVISLIVADLLSVPEIGIEIPKVNPVCTPQKQKFANDDSANKILNLVKFSHDNFIPIWLAGVGAK